MVVHFSPFLFPGTGAEKADTSGAAVGPTAQNSSIQTKPDRTHVAASVWKLCYARVQHREICQTRFKILDPDFFYLVGSCRFSAELYKLRKSLLEKSVFAEIQNAFLEGSCYILGLGKSSSQSNSLIFLCMKS